MVIRGAKYERKPNEFYATPAETTQVLLDLVQFSTAVCDPACGDDAIVHALAANDYDTVGDDLSRGYDFLSDPFLWHGCDIVTNPPFGIGGRTAALFIARALKVTEPYQGKVAMLLPIDYDSGITRRHLFEHKAFSMKIVLLNRIRWFNGVSGASNHQWCVWNHRDIEYPKIRYAAQVYPE